MSLQILPQQEYVCLGCATWERGFELFKRPLAAKQAQEQKNNLWLGSSSSQLKPKQTRKMAQSPGQEKSHNSSTRLVIWNFSTNWSFENQGAHRDSYVWDMFIFGLSHTTTYGPLDLQIRNANILGFFIWIELGF